MIPIEANSAHIYSIQADPVQKYAREIGLSWTGDPTPTPEPVVQRDTFIQLDQINRLPVDLAYGLQELSSLGPQDGTGPYALPGDRTNVLSILSDLKYFLEATRSVPEAELQQFELVLIVGVVEKRTVDLNNGIVSYEIRFPSNPENVIEGAVDFDQNLSFEIEISQLTNRAVGFPDQTPNVLEPRNQIAVAGYLNLNKNFHLTNFVIANQVPAVNPLRGRGKAFVGESAFASSLAEQKKNNFYQPSKANPQFSPKGFSQPKR